MYFEEYPVEARMYQLYKRNAKITTAQLTIADEAVIIEMYLLDRLSIISIE
jgi:hypothetical protein